jgi:hypothetical protein
LVKYITLIHHLVSQCFGMGPSGSPFHPLLLNRWCCWSRNYDSGRGWPTPSRVVSLKMNIISRKSEGERTKFKMAPKCYGFRLSSRNKHSYRASIVEQRCTYNVLVIAVVSSKKVHEVKHGRIAVFSKTL